MPVQPFSYGHIIYTQPFTNDDASQNVSHCRFALQAQSYNKNTTVNLTTLLPFFPWIKFFLKYFVCILFLVLQKLNGFRCIPHN